MRNKSKPGGENGCSTDRRGSRKQMQRPPDLRYTMLLLRSRASAMAMAPWSPILLLSRL